MPNKIQSWRTLTVATKLVASRSTLNSETFINEMIDKGTKQKGYLLMVKLAADVPKKMSQVGEVNPKLNSFNFS